MDNADTKQSTASTTTHLQHLYLLNEDKTVKRLEDIRELTAEIAGRRNVQVTTVGDSKVSTVFLQVDSSFGRRQPPLLFETMIIDAQGNYEIWNRYSSYENAEKGHADAVGLLRNRMTIKK